MEFGWCSDCDAQQFAPAEIGQALHVQDRPVSVGKHAQSFAAPHPHDAHSRRLPPLHDAKRRENQFPQPRLIEFRHYPANIRIPL